MPASRPDRHRASRSRLRPPLIIAGILLALAIVVPLLVPTYARDEPELWGFPFFYWYQLAWVFLCAGLVSVAHWVMRKDERRRRQELGLDRPPAAGGTDSDRTSGEGTR